jgi:hypothetical protein
VTELPPPAVPIPLEAPVAEITGDSHQHLIDQLIALAGEIGYTVKVADTGAADGICHTGKRHIVIAQRLAPNGRMSAHLRKHPHRPGSKRRVRL